MLPLASSFYMPHWVFDALGVVQTGVASNWSTASHVTKRCKCETVNRNRHSRSRTQPDGDAWWAGRSWKGGPKARLATGLFEDRRITTTQTQGELTDLLVLPLAHPWSLPGALVGGTNRSVRGSETETGGSGKRLAERRSSHAFKHVPVLAPRVPHAYPHVGRASMNCWQGRAWARKPPKFRQLHQHSSPTLLDLVCFHLSMQGGQVLYTIPMIAGIRAQGGGPRLF